MSKSNNVGICLNCVELHFVTQAPASCPTCHTPLELDWETKPEIIKAWERAVTKQDAERLKELTDANTGF